MTNAGIIVCDEQCVFWVKPTDQKLRLRLYFHLLYRHLKAYKVYIYLLKEPLNFPIFINNTLRGGRGVCYTLLLLLFKQKSIFTRYLTMQGACKPAQPFRLQ